MRDRTASSNKLSKLFYSPSFSGCTFVRSEARGAELLKQRDGLLTVRKQHAIRLSTRQLQMVDLPRGWRQSHSRDSVEKGNIRD